MPRRPQEARGFTLVELMVIIGVIGLMLAIATPSFNGYMRTNQVGSEADRMAADLALARTIAVSQGRVVQFVGESDGYELIDSSDGRVIRDREFDGSIALDADYTINFFPWGAADSNTLTLDTGHQTRTVIVLPTGIAEVH
jgi:type II secretion system protein H